MSLAAVLARCRDDREAWRYTDLPALLAELALSGSPELSAGLPTDDSLFLPSVVEESALRLRVVFVNGVFAPDLSRSGGWPKGLRVDACGGTCAIVAQDDTCLATAPLEIVFLRRPASAESGCEINTKLEIVLGASARLTVIEHHLGSAGRRTVHIAECSATLSTHAKLTHSVLLHSAPCAASLMRTEAHVGREAFFRHFSLIKDTQLARQEIRVELQGEQAQAALGGAALLRAREHADTLVTVVHEAPHAISRQLFKSVLLDRAKGAFQGKVIVAPSGQHADSSQTCRALLLSDQADMNAKPELEIHADDVHCNHGCAFGNLDGEALFYLRSRGIPETQARALLVRAFIEDIADESHAGECSVLVRDLAERWCGDAP